MQSINISAEVAADRLVAVVGIVCVVVVSKDTNTMEFDHGDWLQ